jgi:hypothetical protein
MHTVHGSYFIIDAQVRGYLEVMDEMHPVGGLEDVGFVIRK